MSILRYISVKAAQRDAPKKAEASAPWEVGAVKQVDMRHPTVRAVGGLISTARGSSRGEAHPAAVATLRKGFSDATE